MSSNLKVDCFFINGKNGIYTDSKKMNKAVKYGRNAISNYANAIEQIDTFQKQNGSIKEEPRFVVQYVNPDSPDNENDNWQLNLYGAAYEEMGERFEVPVSEMTKSFKTAHPDISAEALDLNFDNKVDVSEYATTILLSDILSTGNKIELNKANGKFSTAGVKKMFAYLSDEYAAMTTGMLIAVHKFFNLDSTLEKFKELIKQDRA